MDLDQGGRQLAGLILDAAGRGQHDQVADLVAPLDAEQLRSLVVVLAVQVDQSVPASSATGPAAVCELAINAAAPMFGTTPEAILSAERSRPVSDARAVAMTAARETGLSLPAIAEHFNKDHCSVIHAVRRTAERPRLADAAARVSEHVNSRYTARLHRAEENVVNLHQQPTASTFEPDGPVEHPVVAAAAAFNTTPEVLLGADRSRVSADARAVAMTAARLHGHSLPTIARHFDRDHTTVLQATRRTEKTPPLRDLAAKIAADLPEQPAGAGRLDGDEQVPESGYRSPGLREQQRAIPGAGERPQLRVAR
ncbi:helix-turn-helix domain-containing protein [Nocardioides sp. CPCC 206347]|uniref:helix-turn-helix domain-containing protein n=1 Tax=unclassified Nocardioides TaxID=2615069 RepID=UPI00360A5FCD